MNTRRIKSFTFAALPALAAFIALQACGGSDHALAQVDTADPVEGVWESVITARDCATSAAVGTFIGSQLFHRGGTVSDTNASPTSTRGPGFGTWMKSGDTYTVKFRFYTYDATGVVSGVNRVTRTVTLGTTGTTATSVNSTQQFDLKGNVIRSTCATDDSTKVL